MNQKASASSQESSKQKMHLSPICRIITRTIPSVKKRTWNASSRAKSLPRPIVLAVQNGGPKASFTVLVGHV